MRWTRPESILVEVALWGLYLVATPSHMGVGVDGLVYSLHRPTVYSLQPRGQDLPIKHHLVLSLLISVAPVRERKLPRA
jgi:hypothetical protein